MLCIFLYSLLYVSVCFKAIIRQSRLHEETFQIEVSPVHTCR